MASGGRSKRKQAAKPQAASKRQVRRERAQKLSRAKSQEWILIGSILAITAIAFLNALDGEFVYDDRFQILSNPTLNDLANIPKMFVESVWQFMSSSTEEPIGSYYRPIFNIVLIINNHLFGTSVFGWHLVSVLLHVAATFLVYSLARQWEMPGETAAAAALIFGLHPAHSESVAWVSGLPDPLAAVFILGSLILYERAYHSTRRRKLILPSVALALLAMLSKEVAIVFPVFLVIREWLDHRDAEPFAVAISRVVKRTAPFIIAAVFYLLLRYAVLGFLSKPEPKAVGISGTQALITIPSILLSYFRMLVVPYPLAITYDQSYLSTPGDPRFLGSVLLLAAILIAVVWLTRKSVVARRALVLLILFLLPVLNLKAFNHQESLIHDRYLYLPSVGFSIMVALALAWLSVQFGARQRLVFRAATALIGLVFLALTVNQNSYWQNDLVMANRALQGNPQSPFLLNYIGAYYNQRNNVAEAERYFSEALNYDPKYYDAHSNLGNVYRVQGKLAEAEQAYGRAIELGAPYADTYYNLSVTYTSRGKLAEAEQPLLRAIEIHPRHAQARYNLGWVYDQQGKLPQAEQAYIATLDIKPDFPEPRINLALVYNKQGRYQESLEQLQIAQRYAPDHEVLLFAFGDVYMKTSRYQDAIDWFGKLARRNPQFQQVHTNLGLCYEAAGNKQQAITSFQKAIEMAPKAPSTNVAREHLARLQN